MNGLVQTCDCESCLGSALRSSVQALIFHISLGSSNLSTTLLVSIRDGPNALETTSMDDYFQFMVMNSWKINMNLPFMFGDRQAVKSFFFIF